MESRAVKLSLLSSLFNIINIYIVKNYKTSLQMSYDLERSFCFYLVTEEERDMCIRIFGKICRNADKHLKNAGK